MSFCKLYANRQIFSLVFASLTVAMTGGFIGKLQAAEYSLVPSLSMRVQHDDNLALSVDNEESLAGGYLGTGLIFKRDDEINAVALNAGATFNRYNRDRYDMDNQRLNAMYIRQLERAVWNVTVGGRTTSTRTSELEEGGSGVVDTEATRVRNISIDSEFKLDVSERDSLDWTLGYAASNYDSEVRSDNEGYSTSLLWLRYLTQRFAMQCAFSYQFYDVEPNLNSPIFKEQETTAPLIGFVYLFSETLTANVLAGQSRYKEEQSLGLASSSSTNDNNRYNASLTHEGERLKLSLGANTEERISSTGSLLTQNAVELDGQWRLTERHTLSAGIDWFDQESAGEAKDIRLDREYIVASFEHRYRWTKHWSSKFSIWHRAQERGAIDGTAEQNNVALAVIWRPTKLIWSR